MNDLFDDMDLVPRGSNCKIYRNGHKYVYDVNKSDKENTVFTCICGNILNEFEDSNAGC